MMNKRPILRMRSATTQLQTVLRHFVAPAAEKRSFYNNGHEIPFDGSLLTFSEPGMTHTFVRYPDSRPVDWYFINFSLPRRRPPWIAELRRIFLPARRVYGGESTREIFKRFVMAHIQCPEALPHYLLGFIHELITSASRGNTPQLDRYSEQVCDYIRENLDKQLQLPYLAEHLRISELTPGVWRKGQGSN